MYMFIITQIKLERFDSVKCAILKIHYQKTVN